MPADDFPAAALVVQFGEFGEETAPKTHWIAPAAHVSWDDDVPGGQFRCQQTIGPRLNERHVGETYQAAVPGRKPCNSPGEARAHALFRILEKRHGPFTEIQSGIGAGDDQNVIESGRDVFERVPDQRVAVGHGSGELVLAEPPGEAGSEYECADSSAWNHVNE